MAKYSTISLPKELYEILQDFIDKKPELGYNSVADFCKEAIRIHVNEIKNEIRDDFWRKLDVQELVKKLEMASECREELYEEAFQNMKEIAFTLFKDFRIRSVNDTFSYLLGYEKTSIFKKPVDELLEKWEDMETGIKANGYIKDFDTRIVRRDGKKFDVLVTISSIKDGYIGIAKDITIMKTVEEKIRKELDIYRTIIDNLYNGVIVIQHGKIKFINHAVSPTGYTPEEFIGKKITDFVIEKERIEEEIDKVLKGKKKRQPAYYTIIGKDGKKKKAEVYSSRINFEGEPAVLSCFRITEIK